jgi:PAS domain S-box-containing protein
MRKLVIPRVPNYLVQFTIVFIGYFIAGKLGQATTNIRSSNLGPVWPAYGVALGAILLCGYRIWPAVWSSAFVIAFLSPESALTALGQAAGSTLAAVTGVFLLRFVNFDNSISRFRDALALVLLGGLGSATVSASIGAFVLYSSKVHAYSGLGSAWLIYWLGDSTGVLLVTSLVLTIPSLFRIRGWSRLAELFCLLVILVALCMVVFNDFFIVPGRMMAFAVLPIVIWAAVRFGVSGAAVSIFVVATVATVKTALGSGPFAVGTPFVNAVRLDAFFTVFSLTGLTLASLYSERERAENERAQSLRKQVAMEVRLQNEERLRANEERLRLAQQAARMGTFEWNIRTGVNTWTPELETIYGLPVGGFGGTQLAFENLVHRDDRAGVVELVNSAFKTGEPTAGEWRVVWPDGSVHWIAGHWQVLRNESGEPVRMVGVNMDVTERKLAEGRLREYEEAVEGAEEMIGVIDRQYRFLLANRQYLKMRNLTREQVVGHFITEVLSQEIFETVLKPKLDECFQGKVVRYETKFPYPSAGERDLLLSYFPIEGVNGVDRVACILHDITDRKRAEEALLEMNATLEAQGSLLRSREELLRVFVKSVPAAVAMLDRDMRYLQVSDRWLSEYLPGRAQIEGRCHYEIFPDMPGRWKEVHRRALQGETLRADEDRWESGGSTRWARWEVRPWRASDGTVGGILILTEDITGRKQMEEALSDMSRKLIESQEQERIRIGRELHDDINQRLAMLSLELEQLQENPSEIQARLNDLRRQMAEVSNDVQALSHDLHSSKLEYLGAVAGIESWCKEFAERQKVEIDFRSSVRSVLPLEVGRSLFRVLQEALHNFIKHSGVKRAEVQLLEDGGEIHLVIGDSGKGFDLQAALQGRGLGLISMRERVRLVNGSILIESKPMGGTTIHVRVPLEPKQGAQRAAG